MTPKPSRKQVHDLVSDILPDHVLVKRRRLEQLEDLEDNMDLAALNARGGVYLSEDLAMRLVLGESPLRIFRKHRGLTLETLAAAIGVTKGFLSQIENGHKSLSVNVLKKAATALEVDIDDLV